MLSSDNNVVILTPSHLIMGELLLKDQRLSDFLNDRRESAMRLRHASVARLSEPTHALERHPIALVPKDEGVVAFEPPQTALSSSKRLYGFVKKKAHDIFLAMDGMEVRGLMHSTTDLDVQNIHQLLTTSGDKYLPVTHATVTLYANAQFVIKQDTVLVNAQRIHYMAKVNPSPEPSRVVCSLDRQRSRAFFKDENERQAEAQTRRLLTALRKRIILFAVATFG